MLTLTQVLLAHTQSRALSYSGSTVQRASLDTLLGRTSSQWALVGLESFSIDASKDRDWFSHADPFATVTLSPGGLRFFSPVFRDQNSGNLRLHFYAPLTASSASVELHDEDVLSTDDKIGSFTLQLPGTRSPACVPGASGSCSFRHDLIIQERDWWWRLRDVKVGHIDGYLATGDELKSRISALNKDGIEATEAWTPIVDPNTAGSYWAYVEYAAGQLRYLFKGRHGDEAGKPVSGIWNTIQERAYDGQRLATGPGVDTTSVIGNAYAREAMANLGPALEANGRFRRNELGTQFFNEIMWPEKPYRGIALGDNAVDHARIRPLLDKIVGPTIAMSAQTKTTITQLAEAFWFNTAVNTGDSLQVFTQQLLHKIMLGLVIDQAEAAEFVSYKSKILVVAGGPDPAVCAIQDCADVKAWKERKLIKYQAALMVAYPAEMAGLTDLEKVKTASAIMDALLFAGGVSIPTVIQNAFGILYGEYGQNQLGADFELQEAQLMPFVLEVVRRFPPVAGFPSWDRLTNQHVMIDLLMANLDEREDGWGPTARDFKLRSLAEYHQKHVSWADQAIINGDNAHPFSRVCPAKDLSITIVTEFLRAFLRHGGHKCWHSSTEPSGIQINGYGSDAVSLSYVCSSTGSLFSQDSVATLESILGYSGSAGGFVPWLSSFLSLGPDVRMDAYTRVFALTNLVNYRLYNTPTAEAVTVPTTKQDVPGIPCGLTNITVPQFDENQQDIQGLVLAGYLAGKSLDFPQSADECGHWAEGENPEAVVKDLLGVWPYSRELYTWGAERYTDAAVEDLVLAGVGQHRLQRVDPDDTMKPADAYYAVYLNFASGLDVRPGFASLGADAYFNQQGHLIAISRAGKLYTPNGEQGAPPSCTTHWASWWRRSCTPAVIGWLHAKFAFRGTLMAVITFIDHLYGLHLTVANSIVTANVEELPPAHPLRRLMTPFGFRTEAINYNAAAVLVPELGMVHRAAPLSVDGLTALFKYANTTSRGLTWQTIPQRKVAKGVELELPLDQDGLDYYHIIKNYTHHYLTHYYDFTAPVDACAADADIVKWYRRVDTITPASTDLPPLTCMVLEDVLSTFMYYVSAGHRHVGTIASEVADPCFAPWAWREGELCGTPRTAIMQGLIMATTGLEQPTVLEDYTHMFLDERTKHMWRDLSANLRALGSIVDERNRARRRPFTVFDSQHIETAIGI